MSEVDNKCKSGCGFFGNSANEGYCSKCFKSVQLAREAQKTIASLIPTTAATPVAESITPEIQSTGETKPEATAVVENKPDTSSVETAAAVPAESGSATADSAVKTDEPEAETPTANDEPMKRPQPAGRCYTCNKKIGLNGFDCRCGFIFCGSHRLAEQHDCDFNYKDLKRGDIAKVNKEVVADKLAKV